MVLPPLVTAVIVTVVAPLLQGRLTRLMLVEACLPFSTLMILPLTFSVTFRSCDLRERLMWILMWRLLVVVLVVFDPRTPLLAVVVDGTTSIVTGWVLLVMSVL